MSNPEILDSVDYEDVTAPVAEKNDESPLGATAKRLSQQPPAEKFRILRGHFWADQDASSTWRRQADEDFGFLAGEQLSSEDRAYLDEQRRPHIVFNRVLTILSAIAGMEINGRQGVEFVPRTNDDTALSEVISAASNWMSDECEATDEESDAFENTCAVGLGFAEQRFSYENSSDGDYVEESVDPREMVWDRTAKKKNLKDSRRFARIRRMPLSDALSMFPGKSKFQLDATWAASAEIYGEPKSYEEKLRRNGDTNYDPFDDRNEVTLVCIEWWEREPYWIVADENTNTKAEFSDKDYRLLEKRMKILGERIGADLPLHSVRMTRKHYYRAWLGGEYLGGGDAPCGDQFSWKCITGYFDKKKRQWFGLIRVIRDPQMWANKFMAQIMQILNATAKGGVMAETDAFDNQREAEEGWALPDNITWLTPGALSGQRPKISPKPGQGDPSGYVHLLEYAVNAIPQMLGINLELLGQQDQNQPGVVERMRKQAGMTVLAKLFDSLRSFLKIIGRTRLFFIQTRMSDGRLIRVAGNSYQGMVPLVRDLTAGEYDVVVSPAPTSPNQKEENWAIIQPFLVAFKDQIQANPQLLVAILKYSPLPSPLVSAIDKVLTDTSNNPEEQQYQQQVKQATLAKLVSEATKNQSTAEMQNAKAGASSATATYDLALAQKMISEGKHDEFVHHLSAMVETAKAAKAHADAAKSTVQAQRETVGLHTDLAGAGAAQGQQQSDLADAATNRAVQVHGAVHGAAMDRHKAAIEHLSAVGGFHRDIAAAHRDRVGAVVDQRPAPQPAAQ